MKQNNASKSLLSPVAITIPITILAIAIAIAIATTTPSTYSTKTVTAALAANADAHHDSYGLLGSDDTLQKRFLDETALSKGGRELLTSLSNYEVVNLDATEEEQSKQPQEGEDYRRRRSLLDRKGEKFLNYQLTVLGRRLSLALERDDYLFGPDYTHTIIHEDGTEEERMERTDCFYRVRSDFARHKHVGRISLCGPGMRALIAEEGLESESSPDSSSSTATTAPKKSKNIHIQPVDEKGETHIAFRDSDVKPREGSCGVTDAHPEYSIHKHYQQGSARKAAHHHHHHHNHQPQPNAQRRRLSVDHYLKVVPVNDKKRFENWGTSVHAHSAQLLSIVGDLYGDFPNHVFEVQIAKMYTFTNNPWEESGTIDGNGEADAELLIANFRDYTESAAASDELAYSFGVDTLLHLLTGHQIIGNTLGIAYTGTICDSNSRQGFTMARLTDTDASVASTITHEIGHNLGIEHTNEVHGVEGTCDSGSINYIMDASSGLTPHTEWSDCCEAWFDDENPGCMSSSISEEYTSFCGDGIVQGDEECDCPLNDCDAISDTCCDGATCELKPGKECSAQQPCCTASCTIESSGTVCRAAVDADCDTAEECDGESGSCPVDVYEDTGTSCTDPFDGTCFFKRCVSVERQCDDRGACSSSGLLATDCGQLDCGAGCPSFSVPVESGISCGTNKGCYEGECIAYSEIPLPGNLNCSNEVADGEETDVDCGGPICFSCGPGKQCLNDTDCAAPSVCNLTAPAEGWNTDGLNGTLYGTCTEHSDECICSPCCPSWLEDILRFFLDNVTILAPVLGGLLLLCLLYCCWPQESGSAATNRSSKSQRKQRGNAKNRDKNRQSVDHYNRNDINSYPKAEFA